MKRSLGLRGKITLADARKKAITWADNYLKRIGFDIRSVDGKSAFRALNDAISIEPNTYAAAFAREASERQYRFFLLDWEKHRAAQLTNPEDCADAPEPINKKPSQ